MNIFVTVGTTAFDELVEFVDTCDFFKVHNVTIQYGPGQYIPKNSKSFSFDKNIEQYYNSADFVITHGGAGSIYKLLELSLPLCAIPNLERCDDHQLDICNNLSNKGYILFANPISAVCDKIQQFLDGKIKLVPFNKEAFFCAEEIAEYLLGH
jgi:beta-1,4-N-acetylglucosaminyltransferase